MIRPADSSMDTNQHKSGVTIVIDFKKALLVNVPPFLFFTVACWWIGAPFGNPFFVGFFLLLFIVTLPLFGLGMCFMLRSRIDSEGIWPMCPGFGVRCFKWEQIRSIFKPIGFPFYCVNAWNIFSGSFVLAGRFLLKDPEQLTQALDEFAPENHILRKIVRDRTSNS